MNRSLRTRAREGDPAAFATLFDSYAGAIHRYALRVTADWATAEDVVSLTYLEAWRLRAKLRPDEGEGDDEDAEREGDEPNAHGDGSGSTDGRGGHADGAARRTRDGPPGAPGGEAYDGLRSWLFGIATNVLRNTARSARRHRAALDRLPPRGDVPDFADDVVERADLAEQLAAARAALDRLGRNEREVVALVVWSGLGYAEAAEALGVRVGTVKSRLSRARKRLRELTQDELRQRRTDREPRRLGGQATGDRHAAVRSGAQPQGRTP
ncbi:RNA polymerase sigma factor [Streptodolium elevatio]|uniref:RNA polymerase sigma factor n=1 Tax=Streptodolium elevatio TaxID=3157996 RepID=A0ABV3DF59_9ACTN